MNIKLLSNKGSLIQKECKSIKKIENSKGTFYKLIFEDNKPELYDVYVWRKV